MIPEIDQALGQEAVTRGLVTPEQLEEAAREAHATSGRMVDVLARKGFITRFQYEALMRLRLQLARKADEALARMVVDRGFAGPEQVGECLATQRREFEKTRKFVRLPDLLEARAYVTPHQKRILLGLQRDALAAARKAGEESETSPEESAHPAPPSGTLPDPPVAPGCTLSARRQAARGKAGGEAKEVALVAIGGVLDAQSFPYFDGYLARVAEAGFDSVVLDLGELTYISSAGISVLFAHTKGLRDVGGDLRIARIPEKIRKIVDLLGFTHYLKIFDSPEGAVQSFGTKYT